MKYVCKLDENTTVTYAYKTVSIGVADQYWNSPHQFVNLPVDNIDSLIRVLQHISDMVKQEY